MPTDLLKIRDWQGEQGFHAPPPPPPSGGGGGGGGSGGGGKGDPDPQSKQKPQPQPGGAGGKPAKPKPEEPPYETPDAKQVWPPQAPKPAPAQKGGGGSGGGSPGDSDGASQPQQQQPQPPKGSPPKPGPSLEELLNAAVEEMLQNLADMSGERSDAEAAQAAKGTQTDVDPQVTGGWPDQVPQQALAEIPRGSGNLPPQDPDLEDEYDVDDTAGENSQFTDNKFDAALDDLDAWLKQMLSKPRFFGQAHGGGTKMAQRAAHLMGDPAGLAADFDANQNKELNEAVLNAMALIKALGSTNSGHRNVPIRPIAVNERRAIVIAQGMIDRLSNEESEEADMINEFEFDPTLLMHLKINPMRGLRSAMVGRKRDPVALFVDFSGSCNHVTDLFGLIMTGFAHEGATVLIGGNGHVNYVYQPFIGQPLQIYVDDLNHLKDNTTASKTPHRGTVRTKGGYTINVGSKELHSYRIGALIACTDNDSYDSLMKLPMNSTHVIYAQGSGLQAAYRPWFSGKFARSTSIQEIQDTLLAQGVTARLSNSDVSNFINLTLHQNLWLVNDLESLTDAMARAN